MNEKTGDKLGFWSIVLLAINAIIGSGIFLTPGSVVQQAGSKALIVYFIAAIFAAILAVSFAAASKYVSKSGAAYAYSKAAFGDKVGLLHGCTPLLLSQRCMGRNGCRSYQVNHFYLWWRSK